MALAALIPTTAEAIRVNTPVTCAIEPDLAADAFIDLLERSTLAARRPVADRERIGMMLRHASLIVTARTAGGMLVGVARSVTDFAFCCYLSDLAVDRDHQRRGIGRALMLHTRDAANAHRFAGKPVRCILLSAPAALSYYPHQGLQSLDNAFDFTDL